MIRHETNSSFVRAVEYDPGKKTADVHLEGGSYRFHGVSDDEVKALVSAASVGTHFNQVFKRGRKGVRI
jgi:KTSC domain